MAFFNFKKQTTPAPQPQVELTVPAKPEKLPGSKVVIAVDGPAASGKGTLARLMAERLNYAYLDTGALYRAVALATLEMGADPSSFDEVKLALGIVLRNLTPELLASPALRTRQVSEASSKVAALPEVRIALVEYQRAFALNPPGDVGGAILDGRDIGTVICPDADVKFFVTAAPEERARRRLAEMKRIYPSITLEEVLEDIVSRDRRDSTRAMAPTRVADNAHQLDTTTLTPEQGLEEAVRIIQDSFLSET